MSTEHTAIPSGEIHTPFQWVVTDASERLALTPSAVDVAKVCLQTSDNTTWRLVSVGPTTWANVGAGCKFVKLTKSTRKTVSRSD